MWPDLQVRLATVPRVFRGNMARMKRALSTLLVLSVVVTLSAQSAERVDLDAIQKIRQEGLNNSQVMKHLFYMTDVYGPRLQGSPGIEQAGDWVVKTLQSWGMQNVRKERFPFGVGWSLNNFHATMVGAQGMPLIGYPKAWSSGTKGMVRAEVVLSLIHI